MRITWASTFFHSKRGPEFPPITTTRVSTQKNLTEKVLTKIFQLVNPAGSFGRQHFGNIEPATLSDNNHAWLSFCIQAKSLDKNNSSLMKVLFGGVSEQKSGNSSMSRTSRSKQNISPGQSTKNQSGFLNKSQISDANRYDQFPSTKTRTTNQSLKEDGQRLLETLDEVLSEQFTPLRDTVIEFTDSLETLKSKFSNIKTQTDQISSLRSDFAL